MYVCKQGRFFFLSFLSFFLLLCRLGSGDDVRESVNMIVYVSTYTMSEQRHVVPSPHQSHDQPGFHRVVFFSSLGDDKRKKNPQYYILPTEVPLITRPHLALSRGREIRDLLTYLHGPFPGSLPSEDQKSWPS
ncbi:hypothetical protein F5X96DRAFT_634487 [Biscogniauxia mediterranea]|nr:hypothetical protein F5X96DRAFT_634487 [Biscogniauxia mediterranea]